MIRTQTPAGVVITLTKEEADRLEQLLTEAPDEEIVLLHDCGGHAPPVVEVKDGP